MQFFMNGSGGDKDKVRCLVHFLSLFSNSAHFRKGFTLIELLIVVAIISILSTIALPNFLEAQTRARVARVKSDMRTLATALETYAVLHNKYPKRHIGPDDETWRHDQLIIPKLDTKMRDLKVLTTPIAHLTSLPIDIFDKKSAPPNNLIDYYDDIQAQRIYNYFQLSRVGDPYQDPFKLGTWRNYGWMLVSVGPDGHINWYWPELGYPEVGDEFQRWFHWIYDPKRGTVSPGNIFRFQADPEPEKKANHIELYSRN